MRVITGTARGRKLLSPKGNNTRPTTDKMKETAFNAVQFEIEGARVLDLFAGSGQMGIEALSRGASFCTFVEKAGAVFHVIQENIKLTGFSEQSKIVKMDALTFLASDHGIYDFIFADPPYDLHIMPEILKKAEPRLSTGGSFLCETRNQEPLPENVGLLSSYRTYGSGQVQMALYRKGE